MKLPSIFDVRCRINSLGEKLLSLSGISDFPTKEAEHLLKIFSICKRHLQEKLESKLDLWRLAKTEEKKEEIESQFSMIAAAVGHLFSFIEYIEAYRYGREQKIYKDIKINRGMYNVNNSLIQIYSQQGKLEEAKKILKENSNILENKVGYIFMLNTKRKYILGLNSQQPGS